MALLTCDFYSYELGMNTQFQLLLPEKRHVPREKEEVRYKVLYCLHGHSQDHTSFLRLGNIEKLLDGKRVIAVMPNALRSFYVDGKHTYRYLSYLTKELPVILYNYFHASDKREDNYIAGYSMGGYGALRAAFARPELYAAAGSFSTVLDPFAACDILAEVENGSCPDLYEHNERVFGTPEEFAASGDNLRNLIAEGNGADMPRIYHACGTEDFLFEMNHELRDRLAGLMPSGAYCYEEWSGMHDWDFWGNALARAIAFFGL